MSRISELRDIAYENGMNKYNRLEKNFLKHKGFLETQGELSHNVKRAKMDCVVFDNYSIEVDPKEILVGRFSNNFRLTEEQEEIHNKGRELLAIMGEMSGAETNSTGHRVIDNEKLLNIGIKGVIAEIDEKINALTLDDVEYASKKAFYQASKISLEGVCRFAKRYQAKLTELAEAETDPVRQKEYYAMADNFAHAPYEPCEHFYEAVQCMWFMQFCLSLVHDVCLTGRLDNYLYPYYKKDIEDKVITKEFAFELVESIYLKHNEIYGAWPSSVMIGGVDRENNPVWNDLTYMCVDAIETTALVNPAVSVCYTEDMPEDLIEKCIEMISKGYTRPAIFNDRVIQEGLRLAGVSEEDARYYVHSTCVEITPIGCSNIMVATPYINLNKIIEYILSGKKSFFEKVCEIEKDFDCTLSSLTDFDSFYTLVKDLIGENLRVLMLREYENTLARQRYKSSPLASAFINNCLETGKDAGAGGSKYNFIYPCFPGFLNLVDTLSAIKNVVYDKKLVTLEKLSEICQSNFEGEERIRQYLLNKCDKFGNGIDEVDAIGLELYELIRAELGKYTSCINGTFHPSYFAWLMHGRMGKIAGATPDGRKQGEALSECLGSVQGMDKNGPVGVLQSIKKMDQRYGIGGIATNFRFSKQMITQPEGKQAVINFMKTFMQSDCFEIQFNVVDHKDLIDAQKNPDKYKTLMVRVAGFSDYFVNLPIEIQNEVIKRNEHGDI